MRFIDDLCPPALLYLIFLVVQLGLDASLGLWVTLVIKTIVGFAVVMVLDTFCGIELSVVSWFLVAAPFVITALATAISLGSGFDMLILDQVHETFMDKRAKSADDIVSTGDPTIVSNPVA
jgi:hypothetical protein